MERIIENKTAERLSNITDEMYALVESGISPTNALKKVSQDHNLTPEYIRLIGRAYNTGITNYYIHGLKKADAIYKEKICDPERVVNELYTGAKKQADSKLISEDYLFSPEFLGIGFEQQAPKAVKTIKFSTVDENEQQISEIRAAAKKELESLKSDMLILNAAIDNELLKLADYFNMQDAVSPEEIVENCKFAKVNAQPIINEVYDINPGIKYRKKFASSAPFNRELPPYSYIFKSIGLMQKFAAVKDRYDKLEKEVKNADDSLENFYFGQLKKKQTGKNKTVETKNSEKDRIHQKEIKEEGKSNRKETGSEEKNSDETCDTDCNSEKCANDDSENDRKPNKKSAPRNLLELLSPANILSSIVDRLPVDTSAPFKVPTTEAEKEQAKREAEKKLTENIVEAAGRRVKVLLTSLMLNDPIISKYTPDEVLAAYSNLLSLAPTAMTQSSIMVPMLRKALVVGYNSMDPADLRMLMELEEMVAKK